MASSLAAAAAAAAVDEEEEEHNDKVIRRRRSGSSTSTSTIIMVDMVKISTTPMYVFLIICLRGSLLRGQCVGWVFQSGTQKSAYRVRTVTQSRFTLFPTLLRYGNESLNLKGGLDYLPQRNSSEWVAHARWQKRSSF